MAAWREHAGEGMEFEACDGYFLGRPKIDVRRVRVITDQNALLSGALRLGARRSSR